MRSLDWFKALVCSDWLHLLVPSSIIYLFLLVLVILGKLLAYSFLLSTFLSLYHQTVQLVSMELNLLIDFLHWFDKAVVLPTSNVIALRLNGIVHLRNKLMRDLLDKLLLWYHWGSVSSPSSSTSAIVRDAKLDKNDCQESSSNIHTILKDMIKSFILLSSFLISFLFFLLSHFHLLNDFFFLFSFFFL